MLKQLAITAIKPILRSTLDFVHKKVHTGVFFFKKVLNKFLS